VCLLRGTDWIFAASLKGSVKQKFGKIKEIALLL
jgi:hypothetical protein